MSEKKHPKILIVSRNVWDDSAGGSSTLSNIFQNFDSSKLAHIYIETKIPKTKCCNLFFQISEFSLINRIFNKSIKTGFFIDTNANNLSLNENVSKKEEQAMGYARRNRSIVHAFLREILWLFNGWRSKELKKFIEDFNPDVVWLDGSPLILMNRLHRYVLKISNKPSTIFLMDDAYTYKSCNSTPLNYLYRFFLRKLIKKNVDQSRDVFVCSPKMKEEYDDLFGINSMVISKGIDFSSKSFQSHQVNTPIKLVYLGQVIYGRVYSLISIVKALKEINKESIKAQLHIYTNNSIPDDIRQELEVENHSFLFKAVPYSETVDIINSSDILVFAESFVPQYRNVARLSFSTKITDYLSSGKCIFAIGPQDVAPIEYLMKEDSAIIATSENLILDKLNMLLNDKSIIAEYSKKAYDCAVKNHDKAKIDKLLFSVLNKG
ncbi:hypothetical protein LJB92_02480 [Bacteroidales bacterium OttesenSCG-928-M06]|nr:hypothetical protein [Bacteroidales bacterium OttesenSCG-928-M06]